MRHLRHGHGQGTQNTSCREARRLIRKFWNKSQSQGSPLTIDGFACEGSFRQGKYEVTCNRNGGRKLVRWRGDNIGRIAAARKSRLCGTVNVPNRKKDARYYAHHVRCKKARRVAKWFVGTEPKVKGWICAVSLGRCYEGSFDSRKYVRFPYHVAHPGQSIHWRGSNDEESRVKNRAVVAGRVCSGSRAQHGRCGECRPRRETTQGRLLPLRQPERQLQGETGEMRLHATGLRHRSLRPPDQVAEVEALGPTSRSRDGEGIHHNRRLATDQDSAEQDP